MESRQKSRQSVGIELNMAKRKLRLVYLVDQDATYLFDRYFAQAVCVATSVTAAFRMVERLTQQRNADPENESGEIFIDRNRLTATPLGVCTYSGKLGFLGRGNSSDMGVLVYRPIFRSR
jgi:hypothetical protein